MTGSRRTLIKFGVFAAIMVVLTAALLAGDPGGDGLPEGALGLGQSRLAPGPQRLRLGQKAMRLDQADGPVANGPAVVDAFREQWSHVQNPRLSLGKEVNFRRRRGKLKNTNRLIEDAAGFSGSACSRRY